MKKLFLTLAILGISTFAHAQGCTRNCPFLYNDFSGGLSTKKSNMALQKNEGDIFENVRFDDELRSLTKRGTITLACDAGDATNPIIGLHRFYKKNGTKITLANYSNKVITCDETSGAATTILTVSTGDNRWQWLTWHDIAIGTDGVNQPIKYDGTSASATYLGSALATDAGSGAGPDGTYSYKITCYSTTYEISMDVASNSITVVDNDIDLTMIPICPDQILGEAVIGRKVYRPTTGDSTYKILSNGTIANNTASTLTDSDADGALGAALSADADYPVPLGRVILLHKNRLWLANNTTTPSRLYYSEDASENYFESDNYFNIRPNDGDEITFVKNVLGILTVSKNNTIQKVNTRGSDPDTDWEITDPFSFIGNQAIYSAVNTDMGVMYLGNNGIYSFNGQYSKLMSDKITPVIRDIADSNFSEVWAEYYKNSYYLAYTSEETGSASNNRVLIADLIDNAFSIDLLDINVLHVFDSGSDVEALFSGSSLVSKVYAHTETVKELIHNDHGDFTGTFDDMRFIPTGVGGLYDSPILEIAWTATIDSTTDATWTGTIDSVTTAIIDRPDTNGNYISPYLTVNASSFDKAYWKETLPAGGGDVTFDFRSGTTTADTAANPWVTGFTDSSGSDISAVTGDTILQYRINMSTTNITETPTLFREGQYVLKVTYDIAGAGEETSIQLHNRGGWLDYGAPGYVKELKKIYVYYDYPENTTGTLNINFESFKGETDSFAIDLLANPDYYINYFPGGSMVGELIRMTIIENSLNEFKIKKIIVVYDLQENLT